MKTPSLGYEDDSTLSKREIAQIQLREAIRLFVDCNFLCALTLAGASEEILARLLNADGQPSAIEESAAGIIDLKVRTGFSALQNVCDRQLFRTWNSARNSIKHHDQTDEDPLVINTCDESYWMIRRALANAERLGVPIENSQEFENWVVMNINM